MQFPKNNQEDHVREDQANVKVNTVTRLEMPGIKTLHLRPLPEIAASLAAALKSQANIVELRYIRGECIEITVASPD